jgi:hypothetical protein
MIWALIFSFFSYRFTYLQCSSLDRVWARHDGREYRYSNLAVYGGWCRNRYEVRVCVVVSCLCIYQWRQYSRSSRELLLSRISRWRIFFVRALFRCSLDHGASLMAEPCLVRSSKELCHRTFSHLIKNLVIVHALWPYEQKWPLSAGRIEKRVASRSSYQEERTFPMLSQSWVALDSQSFL